jgi:branched-chain amino acid transport system substrate-binding protein
MRAYIEANGDTIAGRKIELIRKDTTGPAPDLARRLTQELAVRDKVEIIAGYAFTPNALAAAPVLTEAKKPAIILNAATSGIVSKSPFYARLSFTVPQLAHTMGDWAAQNGIKTAYVAVVDFGPGHDAEKTFTKGFTARGGKIVGNVRTPLRLPDFGPYLQRIKDEKPDAIYLFVPAGDQATAFIKTYYEMGLGAAGIKLLTHDITESGNLDVLGQAVNGVITAQSSITRTATRLRTRNSWKL